MRLEFSEQKRVPAAEAEKRALEGLSTERLTNAATIADLIWPRHRMKAQGAGAAASRILVRLRKAGRAELTCRTVGYGKAATTLTGWRKLTDAERAAGIRGRKKEKGGK